VESVLVERDGIGRTEQFVPISVPGYAPGEIATVRVTGIGANGLIGQPLRTAA
jgi:threonylcarbamoyladenosine tRNA methylthiotransferase MtaB